jgi:hypothetical protein
MPQKDWGRRVSTARYTRSETKERVQNWNEKWILGERKRCRTTDSVLRCVGR